MHAALSSPWCLPWRVHVEDDALELLEVPRDTWAAVTFHAPPELEPTPGRTHRVPLAAVLEAHAATAATRPPARYVFHHAFACSTLLARSLGTPEALFTYREPHLFTDLAVQEHAARTAHPAATEPARLTALAALHQRAEPGQATLVKTSDAATNLAGRLLRGDTAARAVLLHTDLETFAIGCLKAPERVTWMRGRLPVFRTWELPAPLAEVDVAALDDGEAAAWLWCVHMSIFQALARALPDRARPVDAEVLVAELEGTTADVAAFLGLSAEDARRQVQRERPVHAKTNAPYSPEARRHDLALDRLVLGRELARAEVWCERFGAPTRGAAWFR